MNSRERMMAALRCEDVDYVPFSNFFTTLHESYRLSSPLDARYSFPWHPTEREMLDYCVNELGIDQVVQGFSWSYSPASRVSSRVWQEGSTIHKVWSTPAGDLHASVRYDDRWNFDLDIPLFSDQNIGHFEEPWLQTEQDLECLKHILLPLDDRQTLDRIRFRYNKAKRTADRWGLPTFATVGMGLTGAMHLCGATGLCTLAMDNPDLVDAYLELEHQLNLHNLEIALDFGVDIFKRNGFYETADFYGPDMLGHFLSKRLNREVAMVREAGSVSCYTIHTGIMPILDHLRGLDFDCIMQVEPYGADLKAVRDSQEGTKSLWVGPSDTYHFGRGPDVVRRVLREIVEALGTRGLVICASPSFVSNHPWDEFLALVDEWRLLRGDHA